ncbi:MAG: helix-turn-helix domain-containing protein [Marinilabiliaceae bacterium]|nr:helix-turn-helix domain-containing protein [Marinilabiliaceae bacterium]
MPAEIITTEDLRVLKFELIDEFKKIIDNHSGIQPAKKWLKSKEVLKLLNISAGTLQTLRVNGTLPYAKIGGVIYYDNAEINKIIHSQMGL